MSDRIDIKPLYKLVDELTEEAGRDSLNRKVIRFKASGNLYIKRDLPAIDNFQRLYIPVINGIERKDLEICDAPSRADAAVLTREGAFE